ncbi:MAG: beta-lactamase family protein [Roseivirga sp.]|nr:beta-lactamase family protein [Roseivirga sp.]
MKYTISFVLCLLTLSLTNCTSNSEQVSQADLADMKSSLDSLLQATVAGGQTPGIAVAVVSAKDVLYSAAYGVSDIETAKTLKTTDEFNFTSIVKTFTATATLQQAENGQLALDKSASSYWKGPFEGLELATVRQMLSHSSGLQFTDKPAAANGQLEAGDLKLADVPGYKLSYSNAAFYSLGQLIAHQQDQSFPDYINENILTPLGMEHTSLASGASAGTIAHGHSLNSADAPQLVRMEIPEQHDPRKTGNGILYSSIEDMAIWAQLHLNKGTYQDTQILKEESYKELWKPHLKTGWDTMKAAAGLGCFIGTVGGQRSVSHIGGGSGYSAAFVLLPDSDRAIIIAGNSDKLPREALIAAVGKIILE